MHLLEIPVIRSNVLMSAPPPVASVVDGSAVFGSRPLCSPRGRLTQAYYVFKVAGRVVRVVPLAGKGLRSHDVTVTSPKAPTTPGASGLHRSCDFALTLSSDGGNPCPSSLKMR